MNNNINRLYPFYHEKLNQTLTYNAAHLHNLIINKHSQHRHFNQTERLVMLAASRVLKDPEPYFWGTKQLTPQQYLKIDRQFEILKKEKEQRLQTKKEYFQTNLAIVNSLISQLKERRVDLTVPAQKTSLLDDYYHIMGCAVSYCKWKVGDKIEGPHSNFSDYKVEKIIKNKKGLQIVVLVPAGLNPASGPIFCCRGTTPFHAYNFIDNLSMNIGSQSFQASRTEIEQTITDLTLEYGPATIVGHSLGGAIAQNITNNFCDQVINSELSHFSNRPLIDSLYYFSAPGAGSTVAQDFQKKLNLISEDKRPYVTEYYHPGDIVTFAGGAHLKANRRIALGKVSFKDYFSFRKLRKLHGWENLISEFEHMTDTTFSGTKKYLKLGIEGIRQGISYFFKRIFINQIQNKRKQKENAQKIADLLKKTFIKKEDISLNESTPF